MKQLILLALVFSGLPAIATTPNIQCTAQVFEVLPSGNTRDEKKDLSVETESAFNISLSTNLDGRAFTLSGNKETGPYIVSITEEPDYTKGSLTTVDFSQEGRLQLSVVNKMLVHKLECFKN